MSAAPELKLLRRGKVRDVYDLGARLLIVATDRLSAFDCILPTPIPDKGKILTQISNFWFGKGWAPHHLLASDLPVINREAGLSLGPDYDGRTVLVKKAERIDVECVARGYLAGSGWKEYLAGGAVGGHALPAGLRQAEKLPKPIFTPATKNDSGHDENITVAELTRRIGPELTGRLERLTLDLYAKASAHLAERGLILADTKFEFGFVGKELIVIDEMLTPDSSRIWDASAYAPGSSPESFDKQYVRDYLETCGWNKQPPAPALPPEVVEGTQARYREALRRITA